MESREKRIILSKRMEAVAALIKRRGVLADIGTDHAYIPIAMVLSEHNERAIAMDLREGPLSRAKEHIASCGLEYLIETRLSDGLEKLAVGEAESIVIAGMGGELMIRILTDHEAVAKSAKELILQPQSEVEEVRKFLRKNGYLLLDEDIVEEDGKYYPMMRAIPEEDAMFGVDSDVEEIVEDTTLNGMHVMDMYGPILLAKQHPVLKEFLQKQETQLLEILDGLLEQPDSDKICSRRAQIQRKIEYNRAAQHRMESVTAD